MNLIYDFNSKLYKTLSHAELWDIWAELKKIKLEELDMEDIYNLFNFVEFMASSYETVWLALKVFDFIIKYTTTGKNIKQLLDEGLDMEQIDSYQPHLKKFKKLDFTGTYMEALFEYMSLVGYNDR